MAQNTSSAVMQQRAEPHDSLDYFPTPPWATRALCEWIRKIRLEQFGRVTVNERVWEPACGEGHMVRPLSEYFGGVFGSDVHDYGCGFERVDFLFPGMPVQTPPHWIVTNPPFRLAVPFALRALELSQVGVALLVRTAFLEGGARHRELFAPHPPSHVLQFCERVPMVKGRYDPAASTATSYCWIVWLQATSAPPRVTEFHWLPQCRARLERREDAHRPALLECAA